MRMVLLDIETTGLDPQKDEILEIAMAVLPNAGEPIGHVLEYVVHHAHLPHMDPFVVDMHTKTGLLDEVRLSPHSCGWVDLMAARWIEDGDGLVVAVGNSVHFDLGFLRYRMPTLWSRFSHRVLDVSSVTRFLTYAGHPKPSIPHEVGEVPHRARGDILRCYRELTAARDLIKQ